MKATGTLDLRISAADIAAGVRESADSCPIALVICRVTGAEWAHVIPGDVVTWGTTMEDGNCGWSTSARMPKRMTEWLDSFDDQEPVEPTVFMLCPAPIVAII